MTRAAQGIAVLYGALWLTALIMYGRPPTLMAHIVMLPIAVATVSVLVDLTNAKTGPTTRR